LEGLTVNTLVVRGADAVEISGNALGLGAGGITNEATANVTFSLPLELSAPTVPFRLGQLNENGGTRFSEKLSATWSTTFNGVISGSGKLVKTGASTTYLNAANTFSGGLEYSGANYYNGKGQYGSSNYELYGPLHVGNGQALGSGEASILNVTGCWMIFDKAMTLVCAKLSTNDDCNNAQKHFVFAGDTVFDCAYHMGGRTRITIPKNVTVQIKGKTSAQNTAGCQINVGTGGKLIFDQPLVSGNTSGGFGGGGVMELCASGENQFGTLTISANTTLRCLADITIKMSGGGGYENGDWRSYKFAFDGDKSWLDLCGHNVLFQNGNPGESAQALSRTGFIDLSRTASHGICSTDYGLFTLGATLAQPRTLFCGVLSGKAGLCWNALKPENEFVFSNAVSTTAGDLLVSNGIVRISRGAGFSSLRRLVIAATGKLVVDPGVEQLKVGELALNEGATVDLAEAVVLQAERVVKDDTDLGYSAGTTLRGASGKIGVPVEWLTGAGSVFVPIPANPQSSAATWTGSLEDESVTQAGNWSVQPVDLTTGGLTATFASGGTRAVIPQNVTLPLAGVVFEPVEGTPGFTIAGEENAKLVLGAAGLADRTASTAKTYSIETPVLLTTGQTWTVVNTLDVSNVVASLPAAGALKFAGNETGAGTGVINLWTPNTFTLPVIITNVTVNVRASQALGVSTTDIPVQKGGKVCLMGAEIDNPLTSSAVYVGRGTTNVCNGFIGTTNSAFSLAVPSGTGRAVITTRKGMGTKTNYGGHFYINDGVTLIVTNQIISVHDRLYLDKGSETHLWARGNETGGNSGSLNGQLYTHVPYAIENGTGWASHGGLGMSGWWDLCGCDQALTVFLGYQGSEITSATKAQLHHVTSLGWANLTDHRSGKVENRTMFTGAAGLTFEGTCTNYTLFAHSPTTGELTVSPKLAAAWLAISGSWTNASCVTVSNGTLRIASRSTFGTNTVMRACGGTIAVAAGVRQKVKSLIVNDVVMSDGVYGGPDSSAAVKPKYESGEYVLSGSGVLKAGTLGSLVIIR